MRKITILVATLMMAGVFHAQAQVGIGTPDPSDASMLDIMATDKGILIPRVALSATDAFGPITGDPVQSLLVYNTFTSADLEAITAVFPGFYYWENNAWQRVINQEDLNAAIENLGDEFTTSIEQIHDLINYIAPSNPNNLDDNGDQIVSQPHSTIVYDPATEEFFVVTYNPTTEVYEKTLIDLDALIEGAETNTFVRKVTAVVDADGVVTSPTVYYYFSEEAIKAWIALDPTANTDAMTDMAITEPGVVAIEIADDVAANFEYILNQTITYEGNQVTIEEIIQMISSQVDGNVIYTEINPGEWVFQYYDAIAEEYVTINLNELVQNLETNTFIRKVAAVVDVDGVVTSPTVYYYFSEEAIKAWVALDPVTNIDPEEDMAITEPGVVAITVADDVADNFEYILNQTITYEGEQVTIEEIIQMISQEVEGNVIYTEVGGEMVFQYYDTTTEEYITINLNELVQNLETNTFIEKVDAVVDPVSGEVTSPTVYYYFSEEAIKDWLAADVANVDPSTMPVTAPGVIAITVADDVADNFEYILNQTITYEGEQVTIEEIIQMISSEVEGNVIYTEVDNEWVFQYFDGTDYVTIDLGDLILDLETKTQITRAVITADDETPDYVDTTAPAAATTVGQILYKYDAEDRIDYLNITEDLLYSIENNEEVRNTITDILNEGGNVLFGDVTINTVDYTDVLYYLDDNGDPQLIEVAPTLIQNLIDNSTHLQNLKNVLGDAYVDNSVIYNGDTIEGNPVAGFKTTTTITGHTATTAGVTLPVTPVGVVSIELYKAGVLVTTSTTDVKITGNKIDFNIGVGTFYQVLPADTYEVIVQFTVAP